LALGGSLMGARHWPETGIERGRAAEDCLDVSDGELGPQPHSDEQVTRRYIYIIEPKLDKVKVVI
jgi:hypothetical protein